METETEIETQTENGDRDTHTHTHRDGRSSASMSFVSGDHGLEGRREAMLSECVTCDLQATAHQLESR